MSGFFYGLVLCCVMFVVGCSHKDVGNTVIGDDVEVVSYSGDKQTIYSLEQSKQTTIELPSVSVDTDKQRINGDGGFFVHDNKWQGRYNMFVASGIDYGHGEGGDHEMITTMGIHAVDVGVGYHQSGYLMIDARRGEILYLSVDVDSFGVYVWSGDSLDPNIPVTPFTDYEPCQKASYITATGGGEDNSLRCFAEDKNYIYAWREYDRSGSGNYELVRVKK